MTSIKTHKKPCFIEFKVRSGKQGSFAHICFFDAQKPETVYFNRDLLFDYNSTYTATLPITPDLMDIELYFYNNNPVEITSFSIKPLQLKPFYIDAYTKQYIDFIKDFAVKSAYLPTNKTYNDSKRQFFIRYFDVIEDFGVEANTPARIHKVMDTIDVSKQHFNQLSVSEQMLILLHEYSHNWLNFDINNELEADAHAVEIYKSMQFPRIEGIQAFTKIFSNTSLNRNRIEHINNLFKNYDPLAA